MVYKPTTISGFPHPVVFLIPIQRETFDSPKRVFIRPWMPQSRWCPVKTVDFRSMGVSSSSWGQTPIARWLMEIPTTNKDDDRGPPNQASWMVFFFHQTLHWWTPKLLQSANSGRVRGAYNCDSWMLQLFLEGERRP